MHSPSSQIPPRDGIARAVLAAAWAVAIATVAGPPALLLLGAHERLSGSLEAEVSLAARSIGQVIGRNPDLWRFEQVRLQEMLSERPSPGDAEARRVFGPDGAVVAEHVEPLPPPLVSRSLPLYDAGAVVARIEIVRSLRPALVRGGLLLLALLPVGLLVHRLLCRLPLEALRRSETALRRERDRARRYLDAAGVGLLVVDRNGLVVAHNPKAAEILGRTGTEVNGQPFRSFLEPGRAGEADEALGSGAFDGPRTFEAGVIRPAGARLEVSFVTTSFPAGDDSAPGFLVSALDVTGRREAELRALHDEKLRAIGRLAGGVAHDFNNVLAVVKGCCVALLEDLPAGSPHREDVLEILAAGDRAANLTRGLLAFSRKRPLEARSADLGAVLGRSERLLRRLLREDVALELVPPGRPLWVEIDEDQITGVLMNLVANARDAIHGTGRVAIHARVERLDAGGAEGWGVEPGDYALVTVADTGAGMGREALDRLFEPFFTTKEVGKGTGLGLSASHGIMHQHGGGIRVASAPGSGTTVSLLLPVLDGPAPEQREGSPCGEPTGGAETLLLAEDDPSVRRVTRRTLERAGYRVLEAGDGEEATAAFAAQPDAVHLAVLDVVMPRANGREALERMRAIRPGLRALFLSGHAEDLSGRRKIDVSGERLLPKPVHPDRLLRAVRSLLDG